MGSSTIWWRRANKWRIKSIMQGANVCNMKMTVAFAVCVLMTAAARADDSRSRASADPVAEATQILQSRIDAAWRAGGGEVVLGSGVHRLNPIRIRSGVRLRLARDARVYGNADCNAYVGALARDAVEPVTTDDLLRSSGEDLSARHQYAIFFAFRARDVEIVGEPGSFVNGVNCADPLGEEGYRGPHAFWFACSTNVTFRGVNVAESGDYAFRFVNCADVRLEGCSAEGGHDGVHFDLCDRVRILNSTFATGDDSIAGSGCTDVVVSNCVLNSACSPFRVGGRDVLITDCRATGPAKHPHRWTLTRAEKLRGAPTAEVKGRRTVGAFFQGYTGDTAHKGFQPGNIVVRNVTVENAERFMLSVSGLPDALWQDGNGISDITFENVRATGLALPAAVVAKEDSPMRLTLRNCSFAFRSPQPCAFFGKNVTVVDEGTSLAHAGALYEERKDVSYDDVPDFPSWRIEPDAQRAKWGLRLLTPKAVFGLLADVHLKQASLDENPSFNERSVANFRRALSFFDRQKADGVVVCGDLTQLGTIPELRKFAEIWFSVFPGDRRSDGAHIERLFAFGDHDTETFCSFMDDYRNLFRKEGTLERHLEIDLALHDRAKQWEAAFHEKFKPIRRRTVKGYDFVLAHLDHLDEPGMRHGDSLHIPGLEAFFATNAFDASKPFFYVQHKIPRGTVGGPTQSGQDDGRTSAILSRYPNAVALCGHKHRSATEELSLEQGAFTTVQVPGLASLLTAAGRENSSCSCEAECSRPPQQMEPVMKGVNGSHALLMKLYDGLVVVERVDVEHGCEAVAEPWVIRWPNDGSASYAVRGADAGVPQFGKGARATARLIDGCDRTGKAVRQIEVRFPPAMATENAPRAYDYEVEARLTKGVVTRTVIAKRVYSSRFHFPPRLDAEDVVCRFALDELSDNHDSIRFVIRPCNAWGGAGEPLATRPESFDPAPPRYAF